MKTLTQEMFDHVAACFAGIWIQSHEHADAVTELARMCQEHQWDLRTWDVCNGIAAGLETPGENDVTDPLAVLKTFGDSSSAEHPSLLVLKNFHRFLGNAEIVQTVAEQIQRGKHTRNFIVVLSPKTEIPIELEKLFVILEHRMPTEEQLEEIARGIATEENELPGNTELGPVLKAACGLTRYEAENAFSLSIVRDGKINAETVQQLKSQTLKKSGLLTLHESETGFEQLGGLGSMKEFCSRVLRSKSKLARPRGILLLGVPGTGKSAFAKALGREVGRPTLVMDVGRLMGGLVGQSEGNVRRALEIVDAMAPAILFVDELEKALSGSTSGGRNDSGVSTRMLGSLLTWLSDHTSDVFVVATSNDISQLPPELTRAERFDGIFFCDLPSETERLSIWQIWMSFYGLDPVEQIPNDELWTGSEIRSCCRLSSLLGVPLNKAAEQVVPIAVTNSEAVDRLRGWANNRCLSATNPGIFKSTNPTKKRRKLSAVGPKPSNN